MSASDDFEWSGDDILECDASTEDFVSSVGSAEFFDENPYSTTNLYQAVFQSHSEDGFLSLFPEVEFYDVNGDPTILKIYETLKKYPVFSPEFLQQALLCASSSPAHAPSSDVCCKKASSFHETSKTDTQKQEKTTTEVPLDTNKNSQKNLDWKALLRETYHQGIVIPCSTTVSRTALMEKHKDRCGDDKSVGGLDFRVVYDDSKNSTGWAYPCTIDESVLRKLKVLYPGWRAITIEDVCLLDPKRKPKAYGANYFEVATDASTAERVSAMNASTAEAAETDSVATSISAMGSKDDSSLPTSFSSRQLKKLVSGLPQDMNRFFEVLNAAGGVEEAIFVCVDIESSHSEPGCFTFPLEISLVPFTFSSKRNNVRLLSQDALQKTETNGVITQRKERGVPEKHLAATEETKATVFTADDNHGMRARMKERGVTGHGTPEEKQNKACKEEKEPLVSVLSGYHCLVYSGLIDACFFCSCQYTSLNVHGIPFDCSLLRADYIAIRDELNSYFQNPSCIFVAKGSLTSPPTIDINGIRFIYAAAEAEEQNAAASADSSDVILPQNDSNNHRTGTSNPFSGSSFRPLYMDEMRMFNSEAVIEALSNLFREGEEEFNELGEDVKDTPNKKHMNYKETDTTVQGPSKNVTFESHLRDSEVSPRVMKEEGTRPEESREKKGEESGAGEEGQRDSCCASVDSEPFGAEENVSSEFSTKEGHGLQKEGEEGIIPFNRCWYHEKLMTLSKGFTLIQPEQFHCARADASRLANRLEKCVREAVARKNKSSGKKVSGE